jgi:hypothetical protein
MHSVFLRGTPGRIVACGVWRVACDVWRVACGVWLVACGVWRVACGVWLVACGVWRVACGVWRYASASLWHCSLSQPWGHLCYEVAGSSVIAGDF